MANKKVGFKLLELAASVLAAGGAIVGAIVDSKKTSKIEELIEKVDKL